MKNAKEKQKKAGFGARLAQAIIFTVFAVALPIIMRIIGEPVFIGLIQAAVFTFFAIISYIGAFVGVKHKWANVLLIVFCAPLCISGAGAVIVLPGLIGSAKGLNALKEAEQPKEEQAADSDAGLSKEETAAATIAATLSDVDTDKENELVVAETVEEEAVPEYIQPKMGIKGKKAIMIVLTVSYSLLLLMGILLASVPAMGKMLSGMGICEEISARAYGITIGVMWVALVPSFGYYFATVAPVEPSKKVKIVIAAVCAVISVAMVVVFFVVINAVKIDGIAAVKEFYEGSDSWFIPVSMVFAMLALMICHALTLFRINPAKIKNAKPEKCGDGFINAMKHVLALLIYGVLGLVKGILTFKEKQPDIFILVSTILLTWLAHFVSFVFAIICIAILITVVIMMFADLVKISYDTAGSSNAEAVAGRDRYCNEINLTEQPYVIDDRSQKVYKDDYGNEYVSDDGGKTVREYHRYDDE